MLGTFFNVLMIMIGSTVGSVFKKGIPDKANHALMTAMGLAVMMLGINTSVQKMPHSQYPVLFIASMALGALIGSLLDLDDRFNRLLARGKGGSQLGQGLSTAILLFCIGTLSIVGPMEAALHQDYTFLFTNGTLDLITSMVLASTFDIGIILTAPVLLCWQGSLYLLAKLLQGAISTPLLTEISIVGGVLIFASGVNILGLAKIKTLNLLPALLIPPLFFLGMSWFH
ncbi:DUF554 domain-containing protein [Lacticaseibacillus suilingensis]|uniref:DUF554 domain-containing protein n=1 Tax=Lacticaseibacillus suilingensis TaxID=2799577 RepID=A0ABW4BEQ8_9LACO|nr:DUF554 domain-containing protein [Lacticaseibacillus suilingensis]